MGRYNEFIAPVKCIACGDAGDVMFQSLIGVLQWDEFRMGEAVLHRPSTMRRPQEGPSVKLTHDSFWARGLGECPRCHVDLWAKVLVREGRFVGVELTEAPADMYDWGYL